MICTFMGGTPQTPFSHEQNFPVLCHSKDSLLKKQINPLLHMDNLYLLNHHYISRRKRLHPMSHECCIGYILTWKLNKIGQRCTNTHTYDHGRILIFKLGARCEYLKEINGCIQEFEKKWMTADDGVGGSCKVAERWEWSRAAKARRRDRNLLSA